MPPRNRVKAYAPEFVQIDYPTYSLVRRWTLLDSPCAAHLARLNKGGRVRELPLEILRDAVGDYLVFAFEVRKVLVVILKAVSLVLLRQRTRPF